MIAWHSTICQVNDCGPVEIPYRAILPQGVENMICPGRHLSADGVAIDWLDLIPQCVGTGQAAGVAVADGATAHGVDIKKVQDILVDQDVPLPRNAKFEAKDPTYRSAWRPTSTACTPTRPSWPRSSGRRASPWTWSSRRTSTSPMWNESCTEPDGAPPAPPEDPKELSRAFLRSVRPQPGCEKDGICNECGLCEH